MRCELPCDLLKAASLEMTMKEGRCWRPRDDITARLSCVSDEAAGPTGCTIRIKSTGQTQSLVDIRCVTLFRRSRCNV